MKQKKINNILYVMEKTPYKITKDLPADYIYVDAYSFGGFKVLNPELNLSPYNYNMLVIQIPEYYPYIDVPDTEIGKVSFDTSEENLVVITRGTVTDPPAGAEIKTYYTITKDGESTTDFFTTETYNLEIIEDYDGATLTAWTTAGNFEGETDETTLVYVKDYSKQYLTFVSLSDNNGIYYKCPSGYQGLNPIYISMDNGQTWTETSSGSTEYVPGSAPAQYGKLIATLNTGEKLLLKGTNTTYQSSGINKSNFILANPTDIEGNIMSLIYGDDFKNKTVFPTGSSNNFKELFQYSPGIKNTNNLILPATTLTGYCYANMFQNCSSLTEVPALPATTLADYCYNSMFFGCTSLTTAPLLPAITLANNCYQLMFGSCTHLTTAPELPATTLTRYCYYLMFKNCTSLTSAPEISATIMGTWCCSSMFEGCTSLTTAPELPATTLNNSCYREMFKDCTSLTTAPELPATNMNNYEMCYYQMFYNCTNLNYIKTMQLTSPTKNQMCEDWLYGVSATGTFVKNAAATWDVTGDSGIPSGWTVETATE